METRRTQAEDEEEDSEEYENGGDGNKENQHNQRLLDRLSNAAARVPTTNPALGSSMHQSRISGNNQGGSVQQTSKIGEKSASAVSHEEWMRMKEHQTKLKESLIREAKKDILEQIRRYQAEEEARR